MDRLTFDETLCHLVDENRCKYEGKRFTTVSSGSSSNQTSAEKAIENAIDGLIEKAKKRGANAYEIVSSSSHDSSQEYDGTPFSGSVTALLYKK
jgi:uncharacterized protein YbjQ (UPF0145 family)